MKGTKINGHVIEVGINEVSSNMACLYKNVSINFDFSLNNL